MSATPGVHRRHQHKIGRVSQAEGGATDGDLAVFEGLAEHFEDILFEFGKFVQK
jgi:hypothetical protein